MKLKHITQVVGWTAITYVCLKILAALIQEYSKPNPPEATAPMGIHHGALHSTSETWWTMTMAPSGVITIYGRETNDSPWFMGPYKLTSGTIDLYAGTNKITVSK